MDGSAARSKQKCQHLAHLHERPTRFSDGRDAPGSSWRKQKKGAKILKSTRGKLLTYLSLSVGVLPFNLNVIHFHLFSIL